MINLPSWTKDTTLTRQERCHLETLFDYINPPERVTMDDAIDSILRRLEGVNESGEIQEVITESHKDVNWRCETTIIALTKSIEYAVAEGDGKYLDGPVFKLHCEALSLDYDYMVEGLRERLEMGLVARKCDRTKLSDQDVEDIRQKHKDGKSGRAISIEYKSAQSHIAGILRGVKRSL